MFNAACPLGGDTPTEIVPDRPVVPDPTDPNADDTNNPDNGSNNTDNTQPGTDDGGSTDQ